MGHRRDYAPLLDALKPGADDTETMQRVVDALWEAFKDKGWSWVGFYLVHPEKPEEMVLGPRRDKPACSPIGLHGCCGRSFTSRRSLVVADVKVMGASYIACDPRDVSEVVVPCLNPDGTAWGVLDVDSFNRGEFDELDAMCLARLLRHVGLSAHQSEDRGTIEVL